MQTSNSSTSLSIGKTSAQNPIKRWGQWVLRRVGLYRRVKSSWLYGFYWRYSDRRFVEDMVKETAFYRNLFGDLKNGDVVFDVGANEGYKTAIFLRLGARVIAIDPDETNQEILRQSFIRYRFAPKPVTIVGKAVSDTIEVKTLWVDAPGSAKNTLNPKWVDTLRNDEKRFGGRLDFNGSKEVKTTTLEELIATYGVPVFIKVDVEGHEASVIRGLKSPVPFLSFEVNLPEFKAEGIECIESLSRIAPDGDFNYVVDCREGLVLKQWLPCKEFSKAFEACQESTIEVFWRNHTRK